MVGWYIKWLIDKLTHWLYLLSQRCKSGGFTQRRRPSVRLFVCLYVAWNATAAELPHFLPAKTFIRKIYVSGGGLLGASLNAPDLFTMIFSTSSTKWTLSVKPYIWVRCRHVVGPSPRAQAEAHRTHVARSAGAHRTYNRISLHCIGLMM